MWIFTRYGFFSVICAPDDQRRVMIRALRKQHLQALQIRFPELLSLTIDKSKANNHRYRIVMVKELWASIAAELAREQSWPDFKSEASKFQGAAGADYSQVLDQVWELMEQFQQSAPADTAESFTANGKEKTLEWDGVNQAALDKDSIRSTLADFARDYNWPDVLRIVAAHPRLVNACRPGGKSQFTPLHQAAYAGATVDVVNRLISLGAWRTLRNANHAIAVDLASERGHEHLKSILTPIYLRFVPPEVLLALEKRLHELIHEVARDLVANNKMRLPQIGPLLEFEPSYFWFAVPGMYGGFKCWLSVEGAGARLAVESWSRICGGSGRRFDITAEKTTLLDRGFV